MPKPAGQAIRSLRQQRGIKVREFAQTLKVSTKTASNIERGQSASIELLYRIANELGVDISEITETSAA
jgi:transcriptional regulator with XRE-family HTH domain